MELWQYRQWAAEAMLPTAVYRRVMELCGALEAAIELLQKRERLPDAEDELIRALFGEDLRVWVVVAVADEGQAVVVAVCVSEDEARRRAGAWAEEQSRLGLRVQMDGELGAWDWSVSWDEYAVIVRGEK